MRKKLDTGEKAIVIVIIGIPLFTVLAYAGLLNWVIIAGIVGLSALSFIVNR